MNADQAEYIETTGKVICGDLEITLKEQAHPIYIETPWKEHTVQTGEEYIVGYEASGTGDDDAEYIVEWRFWVTKGDEPDEESLPWHLAESIHAIHLQ